VIDPRLFKAIKPHKIQGRLIAPLTGVAWDSRKVQPGQLFVAVTGARVDGHNFISKAVVHGAAALLVDRRKVKSSQKMPVPMILVDDPVVALGKLARLHREQFRIPVLAITGTNGKTTTKNLIARVLERKYDILRTPGNLNTEIGLPAVLLELDKNHQIAVLEMGASHPGDIQRLCEIAAPTEGLITTIREAHLEFFGSLEGVQRTKQELFNYLAPDGLLYVNIDDPRVKEIVPPGARQVPFGFGNEAAYPCRNLGLNSFGKGRLEFGEGYRVHFKAMGLAPLLAAPAAVAVGYQHQVPPIEIKRGLESYQGEAGRLEQVHRGGIHFINDAYNANPASVALALETFFALPCLGRRFMVMGDMYELGEHSAELHRQTAAEIYRRPFHGILFVGREVQAAREVPNPPCEVEFFDDVPDMGRRLKKILRPGDCVLLKASRGMALERIWEFFDKE